MLALPNHTKSCLLKRPHGVLMIDAGPLGPRDTTTSTSHTSASGVPWRTSSTAARYSRMASWIFSSASASVAPCDQQPGKPGQDTLYPSSDFCKTTLYRIPHNPPFLRLKGSLILAPNTGIQRRGPPRPLQCLVSWRPPHQRYVWTACAVAGLAFSPSSETMTGEISTLALQARPQGSAIAGLWGGNLPMPHDACRPWPRSIRARHRFRRQVGHHGLDRPPPWASLGCGVTRLHEQRDFPHEPPTRPPGSRLDTSASSTPTAS